MSEPRRFSAHRWSFLYVRLVVWRSRAQLPGMTGRGAETATAPTMARPVFAPISMEDFPQLKVGETGRRLHRCSKAVLDEAGSKICIALPSEPAFGEAALSARMQT